MFGKQQAASSKQAVSKRAASTREMVEKSQLHCGASDSAKNLVDATHGCEGQPHKV